MTFATAEGDRMRFKAHCALHSNNDQVVVNLSDVVQCDSAGLALLIESKRLCRENDKTCKIIGMTEEIQALAEFCGVSDILLGF